MESSTVLNGRDAARLVSEQGARDVLAAVETSLTCYRGLDYLDFSYQIYSVPDSCSYPIQHAILSLIRTPDEVYNMCFCAAS